MKEEKLFLKITALIVFLFSIFSCNNEKSNSLLSNLDEYENLSGTENHLSDIIRKSRIIKLETSPDCLLGNIKKIIKNQSSFFVKTSTDELIMFDNEGNFVRKFGSKGKGPGEFEQIQDFDVNEDGREIAISSSKSILFYNVSSGNFIKQITVDFFANSLIYTSNDELLIQVVRADFLISHINKNGQIIKSFGSMNRIMELEQPFEFMKLKNSTIIYRIGETSDIYHYNPSQRSVEKTQIFDSKNSLRDEELNNELNAAGPEGYMKIRNYLKNYFRIKYFRKLDSDYLVLYFFEGKNHIEICNPNKKIRKKYIFSSKDPGNLTDDIYFLPTSVLNRMNSANSDDNTIITYIQASDLMKYYDSTTKKASENGKGAKEMETILSSINENDNPLLIEYTFMPI